jgi:hypothetical protein
MATFSKNPLRRILLVCAGVAAAACYLLTESATAQVTQVYSFEPDLQGFGPNGTEITVSHETSGLGATTGPNSMKVALTNLSGFDGAITSNLHPAFNDPLGLDFVRFDFTNTNRFAPPATDPPTPGVPTFADASVTFFGEFAQAPGDEAQIQFQFSQVALGSLEPGTHSIEIDLRNDGGEFGIGGGVHTQSGTINGYDGFVDAGFVPASFQIYFNKSTSVTDPAAFAWTVYVDNIRVGRDQAGIPGDFNSDGAVDAADYVMWRKNNGTSNPLPNDNNLGVPITTAHYDLWRTRFGSSAPGGGGTAPVPEPSGLFLLFIATLWGCGTWNGRSVVR